MTDVLILRSGLPGLLTASDENPFVRWELTDELATQWLSLRDAVVFRRIRRGNRNTMSLLGPDPDVVSLIERLPEVVSLLAPGQRAVSVSVPQHLAGELSGRWRVGDGGNWGWFHTATSPPAASGGPAVVELDDSARAEDITRFLAAHSPTADIQPGTGERWFSIEDERGGLRAVTAWGSTQAGAPHLSSVAVDSGLRGSGLGRRIVAEVTRRAVAEAGVCTLGMYSSNDVARGLYESLGYTEVAAWASRPIVLP